MLSFHCHKLRIQTKRKWTNPAHVTSILAQTLGTHFPKKLNFNFFLFMWQPEVNLYGWALSFHHVGHQVWWWARLHAEHCHLLLRTLFTHPTVLMLLSPSLNKLPWPLSRACTFLFILIFLDLYVWLLPLSTVLLCYFKFNIYMRLYYWFLGLLEHSYWLKEIKAFLLPELISRISCRVLCSDNTHIGLCSILNQ